MKEKGFTLIELMVVIVIIGILAAIAVPKLFGMSAKAKAAEVGSAASSWSKLVQVYHTETSSWGNWKEIGYVAPGTAGAGGTSETSSFIYTDEDFGSAANQIHPPLARWKTVSKEISASCTGKSWRLSYDGSVHVLEVGCPELTPNFKNIQ